MYWFQHYITSTVLSSHREVSMVKWLCNLHRQMAGKNMFSVMTFLKNEGGGPVLFFKWTLITLYSHWTLLVNRKTHPCLRTFRLVMTCV